MNFLRDLFGFHRFGNLPEVSALRLEGDFLVSFDALLQEVIVSLTGGTSATGPTGATGPVGFAGDPGSPGNDGPAGATGAVGVVGKSVLGWSASHVNSGTTYIPAWSSGFGNISPSIEGQSRITLPRAGSAGRLAVKHNVGNANDVTYTLRVNGTDSAITVTVPASSTSTVFNLGTVSVAKGDVLSLKCVATSATANVQPRAFILVQ